MITSVRLECQAPREPLIGKARELLASSASARGAVAVEQGDGAEHAILLATDASVGREGFRIEAPDTRTTRIIGGDARGLLYGVGKFLRGCRFGERGFEPGAWQGTSVPQKPVRGMYLATHFHNYYHDAPIEEIVRYVEQLALWGCNALSVWFDMHHYTGIADPAAQAMIERLHAVLQAANSVGMGSGLTALANEAYRNSPEALRAVPSRWHYHVELCPNKPGATELLLRWRREVLEAFGDLGIEYAWIWPYDQGGCMCEACAPWGANGYLQIAKPFAEAVRQVHPRAKTVLSTWCFDYEVPGEYEGLWRAFAQRPEWADYLMVDAHGDFPQFVIEHGAPAGLPILNFTEISMHAMTPWGGFGANPMPRTIQRRWDMSQHLLAGGFPYSEGIYEDINKAILFQLYWDPRKPALETVREYAAYEFAPDMAAEIAGAVERMEASMRHGLAANLARQLWQEAPSLDAQALETPYVLPALSEPERYFGVLQAAEGEMTRVARDGWRWRVLWLRAALDAELHASGGRPTAKTEAYLSELTAIYHAEDAEPAVHPPTMAYLRRRYARSGSA